LIGIDGGLQRSEFFCGGLVSSVIFSFLNLSMAETRESTRVSKGSSWGVF